MAPSLAKTAHVPTLEAADGQNQTVSSHYGGAIVREGAGHLAKTFSIIGIVGILSSRGFRMFNVASQDGETLACGLLCV